MHLFATSVFEQKQTVRGIQGKAKLEINARAGRNLRAVAAVLLTLGAGMPQGFSQQAAPAATAADKAASDLPASPAPILTQPLDLRTSARDYSKPAARVLTNPIGTFKPTSIPKASFANSVRLGDLVKDGKIYLSLSDALALALENNYDLAIARYDLDIADTDILRTRTGAGPLGAPAGLITNTLGGSSSTLTAGGGPGGSTVGSGGAGSGVNGLSLTTSGAGPQPESLVQNVRLHLQPGLRYWYGLPVRLEQLHCHQHQRHHNLQPAVQRQLQSTGHTAPPSGRWHLGQQAIPVPGAQ